MQEIQYQSQPQPRPQEPHVEYKKRESSNSLFNGLFILLCFLIPIVVFPGAAELLFVSKLVLVSSLGALLLLVFLLNTLSAGSIELPRTKITFGLLLLPLAAIISALFSGSLGQSIAGNVFEVGTAGLFVILYFLFLVSIFAGLKEGLAKKVGIAFLVSIGVCILYAFLAMIASSGAISILNNWPLSLAGSYMDLSLLLGAGVILSLCTMNLGDVSRKSKIALWILLVFSLLFIGATAFKPIIWILGIFSLVIFVYLISVGRSSGSPNDSWMKKSYSTLFVLIVSIVMIISGNSISGYLANTLKINSFDVKPSLTSTGDIMLQQFKVNPVTGAGPNNWGKLWSLHKPMEVNQTNFWSTNFFFGSGLVPTLVATLGLLGALALLTFLFFYGREGLRTFFVPIDNESKRTVPISAFLVSLFFWIGTFLYTPGLSVLAFAFIATGLFAATIAALSPGRVMRISIFSNPKTNFISVLSVVVLMVVVVAAEYLVWEKITASIIFNKAVSAFNRDGDLTKAQTAVRRAIAVNPTDFYYRSEAELYLLNIEKIAASIPANGQITEAQRVELQGALGQAVESAKAAITKDPKNYENYLTMGRIYESLAIKGIEGAAESAKEAYVSAEKLNPSNPAIQLSYARIAAFGGDVNVARDYINKAIELKGNYTDAYFTLAQLEAASNNVAGVVRAIESATLIDPLNAGLYFQLGLIKYQVNDNAGAAIAFERAVGIVPDYANAKYFLGLSYYRLRKNADALRQFEDLKITNPDNKEIDLILTNLKANKDPFTGATPPIDSKPEDRKSPPIVE